MSGVFGNVGELSVGGTRLDFISSNLVLDEEYIDTNGLRGTLARSKERIRTGPRRVHGPIEFEPTVVELQTILAWAIGPVSGSTYALIETRPTNDVVVYTGNGTETNTSCAVSKLTLTGRQNQPLRVTVDCVGLDQTTAGSVSGNLDTTTKPFIFSDLVLSINSSNYNVKEFDFTIDFHVDADRFFNSLTLVTTQSTDRTVSCGFQLPWGDASAVYGLGVAGCPVVATFTDADTSSVLTLTMANVKFPRHSPPIRGRDETMLQLAGNAYKVGTSTLEVVTTLTA